MKHLCALASSAARLARTLALPLRLAGTLALPVVALTMTIPALADTTYTPSDAGWGEALTVADGETAIIDAGSGATWSGAITVSSNATLKARGNLTVAGTVGVAKSGVLDLESGRWLEDGRIYDNWGFNGCDGIIYADMEPKEQF